MLILWYSVPQKLENTVTNNQYFETSVLIFGVLHLLEFMKFDLGILIMLEKLTKNINKGIKNKKEAV